MAQWGKGLAAKPVALSSIPRTHRIEVRKWTSASCPLTPVSCGNDCLLFLAPYNPSQI